MIARRLLSVACIWLALSAPLAAQEIKHFEPESFSKILVAHTNRPLIIALWSIDCPHCPDDLALLGALLKKYPALDAVVIATDAPRDIPAITATLARYHLEQVEAWVFANDFVEQLRYAIDRRWQGELPRTYLYSANGAVRAISGKLTLPQMQSWIELQMTLARRP